MAASKFTGGFDVRYTNFWTERHYKETDVKRKWFAKYFKKIYDERPKEIKSSKGEELMEKLIEQRKVNLQAAQKQRAYIHSPEAVPLPESDISISLSTMRPVSPRGRRLLYKGISHENEGRLAYLHKRYELEPKQRYYFQETSGFVYGWHEPDPNLNSGPRYGKSCAPRADFYRKNGIHSDPRHWRSPDYNSYTYMFERM